MSIDKITQQSRRPGPVPSIRVLVFAVVLSALMLAGTLVGLAAAATLVMASDVEGRFTDVVAAVTASAARLSLPMHGQAPRACARERDSYDGEAEPWLALQPSLIVVGRGQAMIPPTRGSSYAVRCSRSARARCLRAASQNAVYPPAARATATATATAGFSPATARADIPAGTT
jgi:hypothetical protein